MLTPERSMEIQRLLGQDIVMAFDECTPYPGDARAGRSLDGAIDALGAAIARRRSMAAAIMPSARRCSASSRERSTRICAARSADALAAIGFDGYAVGGLAVGEGQAAMFARARFRAWRCCRPTGRAI